MCTVYGLRESGKDETRYVGQTTYSLDHRLRRHWNECARPKRNTAKENWMVSVRDRGGDIEIFPIQEDATWNDSEIYWIARLREDGAKLLNLTDGGEGGTRGRPLTERHRQSCIEAQRKLWQDDAFRKRHRDAVRAHIATPEGQEKMRKLVELRLSDPSIEERRLEAVRESRKDPEFRRKMSEKAKREMSDPEARANLAQKNKERMKDPEARKAASENAKKGWADPVKKAERCANLKLAAQRRWAKVRAEKEANG